MEWTSLTPKGLPGHPEPAFHVGCKRPGRRQRVPLMAGSPRSKPGSMSFPGRVLPQDTYPQAGTPAGDTPGLSPRGLSPRLGSCAWAPLMALGTRHLSYFTGTLRLHCKHTPCQVARAKPAGVLCLLPVHTVTHFSVFLPSTRCWYRSRGEGAGSSGCSSGC